MERIYRNVGLAIRTLAKSPGFTVVATLTLALGIGLNTAMFSFMNTLVLRPLPFPNSDQLVKLHRSTPQDRYGGFSPADYFDLKRDEAAFGRFAAYQQSTMALSEPGRPDEWMRVSADFFEVLGTGPRMGRAFRPEDEINGSHRVVVISHIFWKDKMGGVSDVIGQTIRGDGEAYEVIGVLPPSAQDHRLFGNIGIFRPLVVQDKERNDRGAHWLNVLGRRHRTVSSAQGEAFVNSFGARIAADFPAQNENSGWRSEGMPRSTMSPTGYAMIYMLLGLSGFVLLIACSNLANFLLARTIERAREFAVRGALGASRLQIIRPLVLEVMVLATVGGAGALVVSVWTTDWLRSVITNGGGPNFTFPVDWRVLGFALTVSVLTLFFFGVAPALFATRINANETLKSGARGATSSRGHQRLRHLLIVGQFALAMILLAGAGFFVRGTANTLKQHYGWNSDQVLHGDILLPAERYPNGDAVAAFHRQLIERLEQSPGVESASVSYGLPYLGLRGFAPHIIEGREAEFSAKINGVSPAYFKVTGTRLIAGRTFTANDTAASLKVAIINETAARTLFPNDNPIGRRVARSGPEFPEWMEIAGVVEDVRSADVAHSPDTFQVYQPTAQDPRHGFIVAVRTAGIAPESISQSIRAGVTAIDSNLAVRDLLTAKKKMERVTSQMYLCLNLLIAFAILGLFLAALGIYGVVARAVAQRSGEIGIRMALGAQARDVIQLILGSGIRLAFTGAAIGVLGGLGFSHLIASFLPTMQTNGGLVLTLAAVLLGAIALVACYLPARKASSIDPMVALRAE